MAETSSSNEFRIIQNRKFTSGNTRYVLPCDEAEQNRLDIQHKIVHQCLQANFLAPLDALLKRGINVLDVGCGTGRWSLDMANQYPNSTFTGIDVAEVFQTKDIPPNLTFLRGNTLKGLPFPDGSFDYVFQRFLYLAFSPNDWDVAMRELTRITKPGGCLELIEGSLNYQDAPPDFERVYSALRKVTQARGVDIEHVEKLESFFTDQGFTNVVCRHVSCPIGWNSLEGDMLLKNIPRVMEAMRPFIMPVMGVGQEEWAEIMNRLQQQYGVYRTYNIVPVGYGFKPLQN